MRTNSLRTVRTWAQNGLFPFYQDMIPMSLLQWSQKSYSAAAKASPIGDTWLIQERPSCIGCWHGFAVLSSSYRAMLRSQIRDQLVFVNATCVRRVRRPGIQFVVGTLLSRKSYLRSLSIRTTKSTTDYFYTIHSLSAEYCGSHVP